MRTNDYFDMDTKKNHVKKNLRQVMVISLCSVLLCVSCFVGTGWAWFKQNIEVAGNEITLAEKPEVAVAIDNSDSGSLGPGTYTATVKHAGQMDDVQQKSVLYVTFFINDEVQGYVKLDAGNEYSASVRVVTDQDCNLTWTASWGVPTANPISDDGILYVGVTTEVDEEATEPSEPDDDEKQEPDDDQNQEPDSDENQEPDDDQNQGTPENTVPESGSQEDATKSTDGEVTPDDGTPPEGSPENTTEETV